MKKKFRHAYFILDGNILLDTLKKISDLPKDSKLINIHIHNELFPRASKYTPKLIVNFESKKLKPVKEGCLIPEVTVIIKENYETNTNQGWVYNGITEKRQV